MITKAAAKAAIMEEMEVQLERGRDLDETEDYFHIPIREMKDETV